MKNSQQSRTNNRPRRPSFDPFKRFAGGRLGDFAATVSGGVSLASSVGNEMREMLRAKKEAKLYESHNHTNDALNSLEAEVQQLRKELEEIKKKI